MLQDWLNTIHDNKLHHIGEYYSYLYKKEWRKKNTDGLTNGFYDWLIQQDLDEVRKVLTSNGFEFLRDNRPPSFYIQKKGD